MIRAAFFDLDDTLCNAASAFAAGRRAAFAAALTSAPGLSASALEQAWARVHTALFRALDSGVMTMAEARDARFRRTLAEVGAPDDTLADWLNDLLGETQLAHLRRFDDVAALGELRAHGLFVGVITNGADDAHTDSQRTKAERLGLLDEIDGFWVSDAMGYRKPNPHAFAPALATAGCTAGACLYVGDSRPTDIAGANAAGLRSVLVLRGADPAEASVSASVEGQPVPWRAVRSLWETLDLLDTP